MLDAFEFLCLGRSDAPATLVLDHFWRLAGGAGVVR
jgi:hypothetical protein